MLLAALLALADAPPVRAAVLEDVVVTASRAGTALKDMPVNASVIEPGPHRERSADELLAAEGFDVDGAKSVQTVNRNVTLRGVGAPSRVLVLLDGVPIQDPSNAFTRWDVFGLESIDRVEVIRGPVSSLYGSRGMGGVVNFVSSEPTRRSETSAGASAGSLGTRSGWATQAGRLGKAGYAVSGRWHDTDGYLAEKSPASYNVPRSGAEFSVYPRLFLAPADGLKLTFGLAHGRDRFVPGRPHRKQDKTDTLGYARLRGDGSVWSGQASFYSSYGREAREKDKAPTFAVIDSVAERQTRSVGGGAQLEREVPGLGKVVAGLDGRFGSAHEADRGEATVNDVSTYGRQLYWGGFLQSETSWLDERLRATVGLRGDWYRSYSGRLRDANNRVDRAFPAREHGAVSPRLGLVWHASESTSLRAALGRGFQAPTINNLYGYIRTKTSLVSGNPELAAESLWSYEAGVDRRLGEGALLRLTVYHSRGTDFIAQRALSPAERRYDNVAAVETLGAEAEARARLTEAVSLSGRYSFDRARIAADAGAPQTAGQDFVFTPPNKASASLEYEDGGWTAATRARFKDRSFADTAHARLGRAYLTQDVSLGRSFGPVRLRFDCANVYDDRYDVFESADEVLDAPGRLFSGTVEVRF